MLYGPLPDGRDVTHQSAPIIPVRALSLSLSGAGFQLRGLIWPRARVVGQSAGVIDWVL